MSLSISSSSIQLLLLLLLFMILGSTSGASVFRMRQRLQQDDQEDLQYFFNKAWPDHLSLRRIIGDKERAGNRLKRVLFNILKHHRTTNTESPMQRDMVEPPSSPTNTLEDFNPFDSFGV